MKEKPRNTEEISCSSLNRYGSSSVGNVITSHLLLAFIDRTPAGYPNLSHSYTQRFLAHSSHDGHAKGRWPSCPYVKSAVRRGDSASQRYAPWQTVPPKKNSTDPRRMGMWRIGARSLQVRTECGRG